MQNLWLKNLWRQTAGIWPVGVPTSLTWHDIGAVMHILQSAHINLVVEIGIDQGGLTALMLAYREYSAGRMDVPYLQYLGIDINTELMCEAVRNRDRSLFIQADAFAPETIQHVHTAVQQTHGRALIFCDGGDKPREIRAYASVLRPGDLLLAHDYHNEYVDEALQDLPSNLERLQPEWIAETLLCLFQGREL